VENSNVKETESYRKHRDMTVAVCDD